MARTAYFDTSIFIEMGARKSKYKGKIRELMKELRENKVRVYTSMITVQELSVATFRSGTPARDTYGDVNQIARVYGLTKEVALTAAKNEAWLKELSEKEVGKRGRDAPETQEQKLERICGNRRRKWDCFHVATAQAVGCQELYTTDEGLLKRPKQLGIGNLKALAPGDSVRTIRGPLYEKDR